MSNFYDTNSSKSGIGTNKQDNESKSVKDNHIVIDKNEKKLSSSSLIPPSYISTTQSSGTHNPNGVLLAVNCIGLKVANKAFQSSLGSLSGLYMRLAGSSEPKNEKRTIKISQSEPYKPTGRPPNYNFSHVYTSEVLEDTIDISPSLVPQVWCPDDMDCKIRLNVYYSSNLTSGKEVLLAGTTFSKRELQRAVQTNGVLISDMSSEHCPGAKAHIEIVPPNRPLVSDIFSLPIMSKNKIRNPLQQHYIFYNTEDKLTPVIFVEEQAYEPRNAAKISSLFLQNFTESLDFALKSWQLRYEAERLRQGRFHSLVEANTHGWHLIKLHVISARISSSKKQRERMQSSSTASSTNTASSNSTNNPNILYLIHTPVFDEKIRMKLKQRDQNSTAASIQLPSLNVNNNLTIDSGDVLLKPKKLNDSNDGISTNLTANRTASNSNYVSNWMGSGTKVKKIDDLNPSSFVEITLEDSARIFVDSIGRTNTEYHTLTPYYGSNVNLPPQKKGNTRCVAGSDTVSILSSSKKYSFNLYESPDRDFLYNTNYLSPSSSTNNISTDWDNIQFNSNQANDSTISFPNTNERTISVAKSISPTRSNDSLIASISVDPTTVVVTGEEQIFTKYIPQCKDVEIKLDFCLEENATTNKRYATGRIPLKPGMKDLNWIPLKVVNSMDESNATYGGIELLVNIEIISPNSMSDITNKKIGLDETIIDGISTASAMPEIFIFPRDISGHPVDISPDNNVISADYSLNQIHPEDYRNVISHCYDWMWQLGFAGIDPLFITALGANDFNTAYSHQKGSNESPSITRPASTDHNIESSVGSTKNSIPIFTITGNDDDDGDGDDENEENDVFNSEDADISFKYMLQNNDALSALRDSETYSMSMIANHSQYMPDRETVSNVSNIDNIVSNEISRHAEFLTKITKSRVDVEYPLEWILHFVQEMQSLSVEFKEALSETHRRDFTDFNFRASSLKKNKEVQALPINLHYQIMNVRKYSQPTAIPEVVHSVTCGSMSPHWLRHKHGGLFHMEHNLIMRKNELEIAKRKYLQSRRLAGEKKIPLSSDTYKLLKIVSSKSLEYESLCLALGHRRVYALSQSLSIAVNALLLKLGLLADGHIPSIVSELWIKDGFLIVFEGLLSVIGNERAMLEDTISAVDAINLYQARILPFVSMSSSTPSRSDTNDSKVTDCDSSVKSDNVHVDGAKEEERMRIEMRGREVVIFLNENIMSRLPEAYRSAAYSTGLIIKFVAILFTQGIDFQQTVATTFGTGSETSSTSTKVIKSTDLQHLVNTKGLQALNKFCFHSRPITSWPSINNNSLNQSLSNDSNSNEASLFAQTQVHPLVAELNQSIRSSSLALKNVDLLMEVERICVMLGGCRVTFCKSGKDRTGMAITLEQSRQLGERYGCGMNDDRVLRDANLFRLYGCRLLIAEKNIGRKVYSINKFQAQFLPVMFRPPSSVCEDLMKKDTS
eukprot:gene10041-13499_t